MKAIRNVIVAMLVSSISLNSITPVLANEKKDPSCFEDEVLVQKSDGTRECVPIDLLTDKRQGY